MFEKPPPLYVSVQKQERKKIDVYDFLFSPSPINVLVQK